MLYIQCRGNNTRLMFELRDSKRLPQMLYKPSINSTNILPLLFQCLLCSTQSFSLQVVEGNGTVCDAEEPVLTASYNFKFVFLLISRFDILIHFWSCHLIGKHERVFFMLDCCSYRCL